PGAPSLSTHTSSFSARETKPERTWRKELRGYYRLFALPIPISMAGLTGPALTRLPYSRKHNEETFCPCAFVYPKASAVIDSGSRVDHYRVDRTPFRTSQHAIC